MHTQFYTHLREGPLSKGLPEDVLVLDIAPGHHPHEAGVVEVGGVRGDGEDGGGARGRAGGRPRRGVAAEAAVRRRPAGRPAGQEGREAGGQLVGLAQD